MCGGFGRGVVEWGQTVETEWHWRFLYLDLSIGAGVVFTCKRSYNYYDEKVIRIRFISI